MFSKTTRAIITFWLGIAGIIFYAISPILFPDIPATHQPELLPVYSLMIGVGRLMKKDDNEDQ